MKITTDATALLNALKLAEKSAIDGKSTPIEILSCAQLVASGGHVVITCFNLVFGVATGLEARVVADGTTIVSAKRLAGVLAGMDGEVTIVADDAGATIQHGRSRFRLRTLQAADFPPIHAVGDTVHRFELDVAGIEQLRAVVIGASSEETRYYLNGVFLHTDGGRLVLVATDGHILVKSSTDVAYAGPGVIISKETVELVVRLFKVGAAFATDGNVIEISSDATRLVSKLIDGSFPDYTRVIPQPSESRALVAAADLRVTFKRFAALAENRASGAALGWDAEVRDGGMRLMLDGAQDQGDTVLDGDVSGIACTGVGIALAARLLEAFGGVKVQLSQNHPGDPILITSPDETPICGVLMPMRVSPEAQRAMSEALPVALDSEAHAASAGVNAARPQGKRAPVRKRKAA